MTVADDAKSKDESLVWLENNLVIQYWKNQRDPCSLSKHRWCALNNLWLVNQTFNIALPEVHVFTF